MKIEGLDDKDLPFEKMGQHDTYWGYHLHYPDEVIEVWVQNPRYGDYVILGNLVILCEGRTSEHSIERCAPFVTLLRGKGA